VLNNGFTNSAQYYGGDGVPLFSTAHPLVSGGTNSNTQSTAADLNETSLEAAVIQIAAWTDERGLLIAAKPKKLVVPPALQFVATRLLETQLRVGTTDNDINALVNNGSVAEGYTVNNFLTDPNAYFLTTDVPNGMKHFVRTPLSQSMDGDFDTGNVRPKKRGFFFIKCLHKPKIVVRWWKLGNQLIKLSQQTHTRLISLLCMENYYGFRYSLRSLATRHS
jgi:hypothetical protein